MTRTEADADSIRITGVRGRGRHGVLPTERERGQEFVVDLVLGVQTQRAALTDRLEDTVDYAAVAARVHERITGEPVALLETLAQRIADDCLGQPAVTTVEVVVHKPQAPVGVPFSDISIRIVRSR